MSCTNLPLISVVVPVYNVASYIDRCIDSILSQTYTNLEIIYRGKSAINIQSRILG